MRLLTTLLAWTTILSLTLGPTTLSAQETDPPICTTTDGRLFATPDQVRKCLVDEKKAAELDEAIADAATATGRANTKAGEVAQLESQLAGERATSDSRLVELVQLRKRPRVWVVVVVTVVAVVVGGAGGYAVGQSR